VDSIQQTFRGNNLLDSPVSVIRRNLDAFASRSSITISIFVQSSYTSEIGRYKLISCFWIQTSSSKSLGDTGPQKDKWLEVAENDGENVLLIKVFSVLL